MSWFTPESFDHDVPRRYLEAFDAIWTHLSTPGAWLDGAERVAVASETRSDAPPAPIVADIAEDDLLADTARRIAQTPERLHRDWFDAVTGRIGYGPYAEVAALVTQIVPIDRFCRLLGRPLEPLPHPVAGVPERVEPTDVVERGAWLPVQDLPGANVVSSLSYVPVDNLLRLGVVRALYSGTNFADLRWADRALSRPQIELLAARTSAHNKCFY